MARVARPVRSESSQSRGDASRDEGRHARRTALQRAPGLEVSAPGTAPAFGPWKEIQARYFTPAEIADAKRYARREILRMELAELRKLAGKTQAQVAKKAKMHQGELSRAERRRDHLISTVRRYVDALGGELELVARLKGKTIRLKGV
jgi:hypothetical protein